jgi:hypothetical protein
LNVALGCVADAITVKPLRRTFWAFNRAVLRGYDARSIAGGLRFLREAVRPVRLIRLPNIAAFVKYAFGGAWEAALSLNLNHFPNHLQENE